MLGSLFARGTEARAIQATAWGDWSDGGSTWAGTNVTTKNATQLLVVYGCVRLIADSISTLPLDNYQDEDGAPAELPLPRWLEYPIEGVHRVSWLTQLLSSLLLDGNAYVAVLRVGGQISALVPLDAGRVSVKWVGGRRVVYLDGAPMSVDVLHIPGLMLAGSDVGMSPVEAARQTIGMGMAAQEFGARFFANGAVMSGVIEAPGALTPDQASRMAKSWGRKHSGSANAHLPGVLEGGASWKPTGVTNEQAQFLQTRGFTAAEIAGSMFLLDPSDLGIMVAGASNTVTYANLEQRNQRRVQVALMPWIVRLEMALGSLLPPPEYVKFNLGALLRADAKTRMDTHVAAVDNGIASVNERRALEDWAPLPGGNAVVSPALTSQVAAVQRLVQAGFDPEAACEAVGLPRVPHTGVLPVTVQPQ